MSKTRPKKSTKAKKEPSKDAKPKLKQVDKSEFEQALLDGDRCYMKKYRSWKRVHLWWDTPKDPWFMHWAEDKRSGKTIVEEKIGLMTETQMDSWYNSMEREGYLYYIEA